VPFAGYDSRMRGIWRAVIVAATTLGIALAGAAAAHADAKDAQYLAALTANGITGPPDQLIADGHSACDNYGTPGLVAQSLGLEGQGMSSTQASNLIIDGVKAYCPEKLPAGFAG
jgi:Protein of unknown function (DUF732)